MKNNKIILDKGLSPTPQKHELSAASIIADYFKSDVIFMRRSAGASPDVMIVKNHQIWELKSPCGNGKRTIANNLRDAAHQSKNVVLDLSRCKINNVNAMSKINGFLNSGDSTLAKLLVIDKKKNVLDILKPKR